MGTFSEIIPPPKNLDTYQKITPGLCNEIRIASAELRNARILHLNSTALGGGVAELLKSQIPLERSAGLDSRWFVMNAAQEFFEVTKKLHNLLQGNGELPLSQDEKALYFKTAHNMADDFHLVISAWKPHVIVLHDPQPLPLIDYVPAGTKVALRFHIDLSSPVLDAVDFLRPFIERGTTLILTHRDYRPSWTTVEKTTIIAPAIDPFTEKNSPISNAKELIMPLGIDPARPIAAQVSRFDPWKDPIGVIEAYYRAREKIPELQLILAGNAATDDPEGLRLVEQVKKYANKDKDIFFYTESNDLLVNAIQAASDVILQKSLREGFGLTVTEAMWKSRPVIGGKTTGISIQIEAGENGLLVSSIKEAAEALVSLLHDPERRTRLGAAAHETVREKFLMTRYIRDHVALYARMAEEK